ncbi:unnamed protein product, partial [Allacma fusca]
MVKATTLKRRQGETPHISQPLKSKRGAVLNGKNKNKSEADRYPKRSQRSRCQVIPYQTPESSLKLSNLLDSSLKAVKVQRSKASPVRKPSQSPANSTKASTKGKISAVQRKGRATALEVPAGRVKNKVKARATTTNGNVRNSVKMRDNEKGRILDKVKKKGNKSPASRKMAAVARTVKLAKKVLTVEKKGGKRKLEKEGGPSARKRVKKEIASGDEDTSSSGVSKVVKKKEKAPKKVRKGKAGLVLEPKLSVTKFEKDATFESRLEIPSVSTLADSKLLIRAVLLNDLVMLNSLLSNTERLCSRCIPRNHNDSSTAFTYALQQGNIPAVKMLIDEKKLDKLAPYPGINLERDSTGHGSRLMFGHALSQVTVGRGGKEGNGAFLKDKSLYNYGARDYLNHVAIATALAAGVSFETLQSLGKLQDSSWFTNWCCDAVIHAIRAGHCELAGAIIAEANKRGGFGFNALHEQVLLQKGEPLPAFKAVSVVKKCTGNSRITPLHCAAINPNPMYLSALLNIRPEVNVMDNEHWTLLHYAAVCTSPRPLEYLLGRGGIALISVNKEGNTPLQLACQHGRLENVRLILKHELTNQEGDEGEDGDGEDSEDVKDQAKKDLQNLASTSLVLVNKKGLNALQTAARYGHTQVLTALLEVPGIDVNKATSAQNEKMSPLILASAFGHLETVKWLCEQRENYKVKLEQPDRRGRTALAHAVISGHAHIVSYLLRFGLNHLTTDSSGNTLLHYAAAYGWYFNAKLLIEAGCPVNCSNLWKLTPIAAAFMKGHIGIVQFLLEHPDVDINSPVNYQTGMTLLLETCSSSSPSQELVKRIQSLVDDQGADCKLTDYNKNNALHLVVLSESSQIAKNKYSSTPYDSSPTQKSLVDLAKFLISKGCDPMATNELKESAVSLAIKLGCFVFLCRMLENYNLELDTNTDVEDNTLLHSLVKHASNIGAETVYRRLAKKPANVEVLKKMAGMKNKYGLTPLLQFISGVKSTSNLEAKDVKRVCSFLSFLVQELKSDVDAVVEDSTRNSVLHLASDAVNGDEYLKVLIQAKPNLEVRNAASNTPLVTAILNGRVAAIKALLVAGADVNVHVQRPGKESWPVLMDVADKGIGGSFLLILLLLKKGAEVSVKDSAGNSALHLVCQKPSMPGCAEVVQELVRSGCRADLANKKGRTPLHLCVNGRGGETDVTYEVEDVLIDAAPNALTMWDIRGRLPLHYAFVKMGKFLDKSFIDPIELVAILAKAMKDAGFIEELGFADGFEATPLHYAAARGATISASLLTADSNRLQDLPDKVGNTPFGLAVLNGHQACALHFQQRKAKFTVMINKNREENIPPKDDTWTWKFSAQEEEQQKRKVAKERIVSLLEQVACQEWQGILYLLIESLREGGSGVAPAIQAAIKTGRLKLAQKILLRVKSASELTVDKADGSVLLTLAKHCGQGREDQNQILEMILDKGVDILTKDESESSAIIHAAIARNAALCQELSNRIQQIKPGSALSKAVGRDLYGRSVFSALFTNLGSELITDDVKQWVRSFVSPGDWNVRSHYPIQLSSFPAVRYLALSELNISDCSDHNSFSPLIAAVISGNYTAVKWLLTHPSSPADVNFPDEKGVTPIMHAVRLNDIKMVKTLLNPKYYTAETDNVPWKEMGFTASGSKVDLLAKDKVGQTVFNYLVCPSDLPFTYAKSDLILKLLLKSSPSAKTAIGSDKTIIVASALNRFHLLEAIHKLTGTSLLASKPFKNVEYPEFPAIDEPTLPLPSNIKEHAIAMTAEIISAKEAQNGGGENSSNLPKPDPLIGSEAKDYEVVAEDGQLYDCVMTKVDITYGMYGMYNFYKMQLLQQPKGKGMIILFTRWGRVGDTGQFQKTPFGSLEEATKEFQKIFRSKSGNAWVNLSTFNHIPGKYRLVNKDNRKVLPPYIKVDFEALDKGGRKMATALPDPTFHLIRNLSMIHKTQGRLRELGHSGRDLEDLPFGLVTPDTLEKGEEILRKIEGLIGEKTKMDQSDAKSKAEEQVLMESIVEASEEFYSVVPVYGFAAERIQPILNTDDVRQRQEMIHKILHIQFASQLLFAGLYNVKNRNPMEYIYSCLNTKIQLLDREDFEAQMILQNVHNTGKEQYSGK